MVTVGVDFHVLTASQPQALAVWGSPKVHFEGAGVFVVIGNLAAGSFSGAEEHDVPALFTVPHDPSAPFRGMQLNVTLEGLADANPPGGLFSTSVFFRLSDSSQPIDLNAGLSALIDG